MRVYKEEDDLGEVTTLIVNGIKIEDDNREQKGIKLSNQKRSKTLNVLSPYKENKIIVRRIE